MNIIKQIIDENGNNIYPIGYAQGGMKMDLLWTNPSPTSNYAAQTLTLDLSEYAYVNIVLAYSTTYSQYKTSFMIPVNSYNIRTSICGSIMLYRDTEVLTSGIVFDDGVQVSTYGTSSRNNSFMIPYQIYGIKLSYIVPTSVHGLQYVEV